jgi:hypothetical protein
LLLIRFSRSHPCSWDTVFSSGWLGYIPTQSGLGGRVLLSVTNGPGRAILPAFASLFISHRFILDG